MSWKCRHATVMYWLSSSGGNSSLAWPVLTRSSPKVDRASTTTSHAARLCTRRTRSGGGSPPRPKNGTGANIRVWCPAEAGRLRLCGHRRPGSSRCRVAGVRRASDESSRAAPAVGWPGACDAGMPASSNAERRFGNSLWQDTVRR